MVWNASAAAMRRPLPVLVLFGVLTVLGAVSFGLIPVTRTPNIDVPVVSVAISEGGAAPAEIETQVTRRVEDAVAGITGVKHVSSTISDGVSLTVVELRLEANEDRALNDVKDAISRIRDELPAGIDEPIVSRVDVVGTPIQTFAASAPGMTQLELSRFVDDEVVRRLHGLSGIADIRRVGGVQREIRVTLDPDRLGALGITAPEVSRQIASTNINLPGGRAELGGGLQTIRVLAGADTLARLQALSIVLPNGLEARLSDLGTIVDGIREPRVFARLDGRVPVVAFAIERGRGASDVSVAAGVQSALHEIQHAHPGVSFSLIDDEVRGTRVRFTAAIRALFEGAVLVMIVVLLFLRDRRATLVASAALPLSVVPTCLVIHLLGFSFNFVSLLAITLASGILVDDAVVEIENIVRHMRMGKSPRQATIDATAEIGTTVIGITLTIVAIFAPVSFMTGVAGQYFRQFGLTIAAAVIASLLVARLLTPLMAAAMLRPPGVFMQARGQKTGWLGRTYGRVLRRSLGRPYVTLTLGLVLFSVFLAATFIMPSDFIPPSDEARSVLSIELPPGVSLDDTLQKTDRIARDFMQRVPQIKSIFTDGGESATGGNDVRVATMTIRYTPRAQRSVSQKTLETTLSALLARIPDVRGWYLGAGGQRALQLDLLSRNEASLAGAASALEGGMRRDGAFANVSSSSGLASTELAVVPRPDLAAHLGVTGIDIADVLRIATIGDVAAKLPQFLGNDRMVPIRVEMGPEIRHDAAALGALTVPGKGGAAIPLLAVADFGYREGPSTIERFDGERRVTVAADLPPGVPLGTAIARMQALPEARHLPAGVRIQSGGDAEVMGEVFSGLAIAMGTGLLLVFALLVLLFGDVFQPLTILFSLPLSLGGVVLGLLATNRPLSMPVMIGLLMLMGIVAKNAIMIVDFTNRGRRAGAVRRQALLEACGKRVRPIVMTTVAMVAGMVPTALSAGDGGEFRSPMAIAVIGGLITSTVLSLLFVPAFYVAMDDLHGWFARRFRRAAPRRVSLRGALSPEASGAD